MATVPERASFGGRARPRVTAMGALTLAAGTLGTFDLSERIDAAARAGFSGLGLRAEDLEFSIAQGLSVPELRRRLDDSGLRVTEVQFVADWAAEGDAEHVSLQAEERCYAVADALGGEILIAADSEQPHGWIHAVERFARLCDRAAAHGLSVSIEFLPWGTIPDAATAARLVTESGRDNAGILLDCWHFFRGTGEEAMLRAIPPRLINGLQLNDADAVQVGTLYEDTRSNRRFPGEGDFDLVRFVRLVDELGLNLPWSVEVLSDAARAMQPATAAMRAAECTRDLLRRARSQDES